MKILVILPRFPYPLEKGDKLRAYHQIRMLARNNEVYLFALTHERVEETSLQEMQRFCKEIVVARISKILAFFYVVRNLFTVRSLQIGYWDSRKAMRQLRQFEACVRPDVLYSQMVRTIRYAAHSDLPKVIDFQDALSMNLERRMATRRGIPYFVLHYEFKMLRSAEYNATSLFDGMTIISEKDRDAIPQHHSTAIDVVRNGVDFDYFSPVDVKKRYDIVFSGNMQYKPNIDAARYLVNEVMPYVLAAHPGTTVLLAGATPAAAVRQLASQLVIVTGTVDDIRPCYAISTIFVAPMRIGSGLQNKLLEAMSMGIPCVTTSLANDSLGATDGQHILVGDTPTQIADAIIRLIDDKNLCKTLAENAKAFVRSHYSWESAGDALESILQRAITTHRSHEKSQLEDE